MNKQTENQLRTMFKEQLHKAFSDGIASGTRAVCSVVYEFACDPALDDAQARKKIMDFCSTPLKKESEEKEG